MRDARWGGPPHIYGMGGAEAFELLGAEPSRGLLLGAGLALVILLAQRRGV